MNAKRKRTIQKYTHFLNEIANKENFYLYDEIKAYKISKSAGVILPTLGYIEHTESGRYVSKYAKFEPIHGRKMAEAIAQYAATSKYKLSGQEEKQPIITKQPKQKTKVSIFWGLIKFEY